MPVPDAQTPGVPTAERLLLALRNPLIVLFEQDPDLRYRWIHNPQYGFDPEVVVGQGDADLFDPGPDLDRLIALKREVLASGRGRVEEVRTTALGGARRWFLLALEPVHGPEGGLTGAGTDITRQKEEENLLRLMMGALGHDLRNPLAAVALTAALLRKDPQVDERLARGLQRITSSADRMGRMISDLLDATRATMGGIPIRRADADLDEACRDLVEEIAAAHPGRVVHAHLAGCRGPFDPDRLKQALGNLVANALQHGDPAAPVEVRSRCSGNGALIEVRNGGAPIPAELLPQLFEPFRSGRAGGAGLGLGLFIAREIVRAHGGEISVASGPSSTAFTIRLPLAG